MRERSMEVLQWTKPSVAKCSMTEVGAPLTHAISQRGSHDLNANATPHLPIVCRVIAFWRDSRCWVISIAYLPFTLWGVRFEQRGDAVNLQYKVCISRHIHVSTYLLCVLSVLLVCHELFSVFKRHQKCLCESRVSLVLDCRLKHSLKGR